MKFSDLQRKKINVCLLPSLWGGGQFTKNIFFLEIELNIKFYLMPLPLPPHHHYRGGFNVYFFVRN